MSQYFSQLPELFVLLFIAIFVILYRNNKKPTKEINKFIQNNVSNVYEKYSPYSLTAVQKKVKELGQNYTFRQYIVQVAIIGGLAGVISYFYFYSIIIALVYAGIAVMFVPYLAWLRSKRIYSEYIFEQVQTYTTNVIMEFNTTQSFVKSLEGVRDSGIIEEPVLSDLKEMIDMSYKYGTIDESIAYFNQKYPFYMVKNMNQLFLQITKEGARDSGQSLENMAMDIDALVEGVYRDQMDRRNFHTKFLTFGLVLFTLVIFLQFMLGTDRYQALLQTWYVDIILHAILIINSYFLINGEKYYNEDVGGE